MWKSSCPILRLMQKATLEGKVKNIYEQKCTWYWSRKLGFVIKKGRPQKIKGQTEFQKTLNFHNVKWDWTRNSKWNSKRPEHKNYRLKGCKISKDFFCPKFFHKTNETICVIKYALRVFKMDEMISNDIILCSYFFFSCLKMHHFR